MQRVTITLTCYYTRYRTFSLSLAWLGAICYREPRAKKRILLFS